MAHIVILGSGVMGSAFSFPLLDSGHDISIVGTHLDMDWIEAMKGSGVHPRIGIALPERAELFHYYQLPEAISRDTELIVFGVSSPGINWAIDTIGPLLKKPIPILLLTKGLTVIDGQITILPHLVKRRLKAYGLKDIEVGGVGGPCIAAELACRRHTSVTIAFENETLLNRFIPLIETPYYHAVPSLDLVGVEICAALKNLYALGVGSANGLLEKDGHGENGALMHNLSSGIFTQALFEMAYLVTYFGGSEANVHGLAGTGDFFVTCMAGRNSRMGRLLGLGLSFKEAKSTHMAEDTVEGADLALTVGPTLDTMIEEEMLDGALLPLLRKIIDAVCRNKPLELPWKSFYRTAS